MPDYQKRVQDNKSAANAACFAESVESGQRNSARQRVRISHRRCTVTMVFILVAVPSLCGQSMKPIPADRIQYVTANGTDSNDGLSWGTAKATIAAAYGALPTCTIGSMRWPHCGTIKLGAHSFTVSSPIRIDSPFVSIRGRSPFSTVIEYVGKTGCAIEWTGFTAYPGNALPLNLSDIAVDGASAGAGTCGLKTYDIVSFTARNVAIKDFSGAGSIGWDDTAVSGFNERMDVSMTLGNNTTSWMLEGAVGRTGYQYSNTTFGYGNFNLWINTSARGQVGIHADNYALIQFSNLHIIENLMAGTTALELTNHSELTASLVDLHFEGGTIGLSTDATSIIQAIGSVHESAPMTDSFGGTYPQDYIFGHWNGPCPSGNSCWLSFAPYQKASNNYALTLGNAKDVGRSAELAIGVPLGSYNPPFAIGNAGNVEFWIDTSGNPHASSGYLISAGTVRLSGGTASHTFGTVYTSAPVCTAADETSAAAVRVESSRTAVTITASSNTRDLIAWICTPLAN